MDPGESRPAVPPPKGPPSVLSAPLPPADQTGPLLVLPKGGKPSQPQTLTPQGSAACLLPCVRG